MSNVITGRDFGRALCGHFGLPSNQVGNDIRVNTGSAEVMSVSLTLFLTPADLIGIGSIANADKVTKADITTICSTAAEFKPGE